MRIEGRWPGAPIADSLMAMSTVVFGVLIVFVVASMIHFLHEWWDARRDHASDAKDDRHH